jgi:2-Cys peroxiredoxin 5
LDFDPASIEIDPVDLAFPPVSLGELQGERVEVIDLQSLVRTGRAVLLGVPGAFTPICTHQHVPEFVASASELRSAGYSTLVCIAPESPWVVHHWARQVDPEGKIRFLSDGNLAMARLFGLLTSVEDVFLGECSMRYLMSINAGVVERLRVERQIGDMCRTSARLLLDEVR